MSLRAIGPVRPSRPTRTQHHDRFDTQRRVTDDRACCAAQQTLEPQADPEVRSDVVARARQRLASGFYDEPLAAHAVADQLARLLAG